MSEALEKPVRRTAVITTQCYCVTMYRGRPESKNRCDNDTFSPDSPFCEDCWDRHATDKAVIDGKVVVTVVS